MVSEFFGRWRECRFYTAGCGNKMAVSVTGPRAVNELGGPVIPGRYWDGFLKNSALAYIFPFSMITGPILFAYVVYIFVLIVLRVLASTNIAILFLLYCMLAVYPANTRHLYNIYTMSAQRLRRWSNIA